MNRADLPEPSTPRRRGTFAVPVLVVLLIAPFILAAAPVRNNNSEAFEQWFNAPDDRWTTGGINEKSSYREGDVVPFRLALKGLTPDTEYSFDITYAAVQKGINGFDRLETYDTSENVTPCVSAWCASGSPASDGGVTVWGGDAVAASLSPGTTGNNGTRNDTVTVTFTTHRADPVIAWGGHLAEPTTEGAADGASYISGSPLGMTTNVSGALHLSAGAWLREGDREPPTDPTCTGSITAVMVEGTTPRTGTLDGSPTVALNGAATTDVACGTYSYTATAPSGWQLASGTTNPQTAQLDDDGETATLTWIVEPLPCDGTITATMTAANGDPVTGGSLSGSPTVALNGAATTDVACGTYSYTATAPSGWRFVSRTANPKAATVTNAGSATLTWTVQPVVVPDPDPDPVIDLDPVIDPDPVIDSDPITDPDPVVEDEDPAVDDGPPTCTGAVSVQVRDLVGEAVPGAHVALDGQDSVVGNDGFDATDIDCGAVEVELTSVPDGYVFLRTEVDAGGTFSAQSTHSKSRKISTSVSDGSTTAIVFVIDPLDIMPEKITGPAPERHPRGAPDPALATDEPDPAPQSAPVEPVAQPVDEPTLPRTGIPAGRLLALAALMVTAGSAILGSRRSVDR